MEVGVMKRGASWDGGIIRWGSKSKGGRSGPLTGPVSCLSLTTLGEFLEAQQLFRTVGGPTRGRSPDGGEATDIDTGSGRIEVAT